MASIERQRADLEFAALRRAAGIRTAANNYGLLPDSVIQVSLAEVADPLERTLLRRALEGVFKVEEIEGGVTLERRTDGHVNRIGPDGAIHTTVPYDVVSDDPRERASWREFPVGEERVAKFRPRPFKA